MGVTLDDRATLELNGHTISGGCFGVWVLSRGTIRGPGQIVAGGWQHAGTRVRFTRRLEISDVTADGGFSGISSYGTGDLYATNVTANNAMEIGFEARRLKGSNLTANGNAVNGIRARSARDLNNITANFNGGGSWGGEGILVARTLVATNVETKGNAMSGVLTERTARITGLVSMNNGRSGLESYRGAMLVDSTLSDNESSGDGVDILSARYRL